MPIHVGAEIRRMEDEEFKARAYEVMSHVFKVQHEFVNNTLTRGDRTSFDVGYAYGQWKTLRDNYSLSRISRASRTDENVTTGHLTATLSYRF